MRASYIVQHWLSPARMAPRRQIFKIEKKIKKKLENAEQGWTQLGGRDKSLS